MKFQLTKKNLLIGFIVMGLVAMTIVMIILLKPGQNPDGCGSGWLCKNPDSTDLYNKCLDKDFCSNYGLADNKADCKCKADCPDGQQSFPSSVNMKKDPTTNKWIPNDTTPTCGIPCDDAKTTTPQVSGAVQGPGYCAPVPEQYCGTGNIHVQGQTVNVWEGCFPKSSWEQCDKSICLINSTGDSCTTDGYCNITDYCGKDNSSDPGVDTNLYQACETNDQCYDVYGNQGTCYFNDVKLTNKNIKKVGYCKANYGETLYFQPAPGNLHCTTLDKIGNDKSDNLAVCIGTAVGVDGSIQCKDTDAVKGCAPYGICSTNYWQANFDSTTSSTCLSNQTYDSSKTPLCCSTNRIIVSSTDKWCCPVENTTDCSNTTAKPYSANMLNISGKNYTDSIDCNVTQNGRDTCDDYNINLLQSLTVDGFTPSSTVGDSKFAKLFCDTSLDPLTNNPINKCKAKCGYVDSQQGIPVEYVVSDDSNTDPTNPISFCTPKNTNCSLLPTQNWNNVPSPVNNIPICYNSENVPTGKSTGKFYWSAPDDPAVTYQNSIL